MLKWIRIATPCPLVLVGLIVVSTPAVLHAQPEDFVKHLEKPARNLPQEIATDRKAIETLDSQPVKDSAQLLPTLRHLAIALRLSGDQECLVVGQRALDLSEPPITADTKETPIDASELAHSLLYFGQPRDAEKILRSTLNARTKRLGKKHPAVASAFFQLGELYQEMNDVLAINECHQRALEIRRAALGPQHSELADSLLAMARARGRAEKMEEVEPLLVEALKMRLALAKGQPDARLAQAQAEMAFYFQNTGREQDAFQMFRVSYTTLVRLPDWENPFAVEVFARYANLTRDVKDYANAAVLYECGLKLATRVLGEKHRQVAIFSNNLGQAASGLGDFAKAESCFLRAIELDNLRYGPDNVESATSYSNLGALYSSVGQNDKSLASYEHSQEIFAKVGGPGNRRALSTAVDMVIVLVQTTAWDKAVTTLDNVLRRVCQLNKTVLPVLSEAEQMHFLWWNGYGMLNVAYSAALAQRDDPKWIEHSAEWCLNFRGLSTEALAGRARLIRDSQSPKTKALASELLAVRKQLAARGVQGTVNPFATGEEAITERLWGEERRLAKQLGALSRPTSISNDWIELAEIRKKLDANTVLIQYAVIERFDFPQAGIAEKRLVAWVIPPNEKGKPQILDLGPLEPIADALDHFREALAIDQAGIAENGEHAAEKRLREAMAPLSRLVLDPLRPAISDFERVHLSPDGILWLMPWCMMDGSDGKYLVEQYEIDFLLTARELLRERRIGKPTKPLIFANPDYDADLPRDFQGPRIFGPLPGTLDEAKAVLPKLTKYSGKKPELLSGKKATEERVKAVKSPQLLMLSTHGFFVNPAEWMDFSGENHLNHPLVKCGVALAGANGAGKGADQSDNDGILTGLEAVSLDLRDTELVILSACETGRGMLAQGEGAAGLRQSFLLAGAGTVVDTLWPIPDRETAVLMAHFADHLAKRERPATALRQAQIAVIQARRKKHESAHPLYWAAFSATGAN